jgi:NAD(P)-dependent dehydrogenase (short-subunit alcohol dehydrogenase family)
VNAISPGIVLAGPSEQGERAEVLMRGTPAGAGGPPDAIANAALYLASDRPSSCAGQ